MKELNLIVTHPGQAHRDEFLACAILLARHNGLTVARREPTASDLKSIYVAVVDVGGRSELNFWNLDHHQMPRGTLTCAVDLVLQALGYGEEEYRKIFQWAEFTTRLDATGPGATADWLGCSREALEKTVSPIETTVLRWFQSEAEIRPGTPLHGLMIRVGTEKLTYLDLIQSRIDMLEDLAVLKDVGQLRVLDVTRIPGVDSPTLGLDLFIRLYDLRCQVTVTCDDRGPGLSLFRRNDDPRIDFSRLEGREEILFAHKGGFVAKTKSPDVDWPELIKAAIVPEA